MSGKNSGCPSQNMSQSSYKYSVFLSVNYVYISISKLCWKNWKMNIVKLASTTTVYMDTAKYCNVTADPV